MFELGLSEGVLLFGLIALTTLQFNHFVLTTIIQITTHLEINCLTYNDPLKKKKNQ